jgi:hypothetical protein
MYVHINDKMQFHKCYKKNKLKYDQESLDFFL